MQKVKNLEPEQIKELEAFIKDRESSGTETRRAQAILILCSGGSKNIIWSLTGFDKKHVFKLREKVYPSKDMVGKLVHEDKNIRNTRRN